MKPLKTHFKRLKIRFETHRKKHRLEHFKHQPLKSPKNFRLIYLEPVEDDVFSISCTLTEYDQNLAPPYVALSYTWGDPITGESEPRRLATIFVNKRAFRIHTNLFRALKALRNKEARLWVDAICIDQQNIQERGVQVALMGDIFRGATKVCAWLGPATEDSDFVFDAISSYNDTGQFQLEFNRQYFKSIWRFSERIWFKRAWIIQEVALAKDVLFVCGRKMLAIAAWERAQLLSQQQGFIKTPSPIAHSPLQTIIDLRRRLHRGDRISALGSLQMTRHAEATDPRDCIFAKMAISNNELAELCPPNYDISAEELWRIFFQEYVQQKKDLYVICLANNVYPQNDHLPSWLPDWSYPKYPHPLCNFYDELHPEWPHFDAAKGTEPSVLVTQDRCHLLCIGLEIDEVDGIGNGSKMMQSTASTNAYKTTEGAFQALVRTMIADTNRWEGYRKSSRDFVVLVATQFSNRFELSKWLFDTHWRNIQHLRFRGITLKDLAQSQLERLLPDDRVERYSLWQAFEYSMVYTIHRRQVFTTLRGYLGLGPEGMKPKDKIVILKGCRVPVILRREDQYWKLIGECYVDGIMYGEGLDNNLGDDQEPAWITFDII
ncbi:heterokaryon incompatibility protein-domain-containing protein [Hypoxylon rubiginosum]|uniref:Heterokaryon incompatibility protein-domain-containing protein n=1 Tax=Hypoxylon rubiginosum TaxID=110542 RepID=A0ACC0D8M2_9PEZI|nr:heterokaryon incompatibility protein-domain-containing protein [Hypoxylon rubiginosum]